MGLFSSNVILFTILLRLLTETGLSGFEQDQSIREGHYWRERGLSAPRSSYRQIHFYERSLAADPGVAAVHLELAEIYYDLAIAYGHRDLFDQALESLFNALQADPELAPAHYRRGTIYFLLGDFAASRRELEAARRLDPSYSPAEDGLRMLRHRR
ncbi:MAG: tetratricopeptide repeat protein [Candidatus Erginobacter occultus]|nr:tetratricopeptide repeat protein [Candidatus Erginobacter occultus]